MITDWDVIDDAWSRPLVEVLVDGQWCRGEVRARRKNGDRWEAWTTYATAPGENRSGVFDEAAIRPDGTIDHRLT